MLNMSAICGETRWTLKAPEFGGQKLILICLGNFKASTGGGRARLTTDRSRLKQQNGLTIDRSRLKQQSGLKRQSCQAAANAACEAQTTTSNGDHALPSNVHFFLLNKHRTLPHIKVTYTTT